jgi:hypothetical protein
MGKAGACHSGAPYGIQLQWLAPSLAPQYLTSVENSLRVANAAAYYYLAIITTVKRFKVQALGTCTIKTL